ncbi:flavodoxin family protein [Candidatus Curtissbacteria bacterium]|nr:flavodoxin family protein [Candidatus Curtissbacteria bacterium]
MEIVMETIAKVLHKNHFEIFLSRAEKTTIETIKNNRRFVFGTSTWEHGLLNPFFQKLYEEMQGENFENKEAAFVGLGDKRYEPVLFCEAIEQIRRLWLKKNGKKIGTILKIQGEPYEKLNSHVAPWASQIAQTWTTHRA